jgi:hypothetical protein
MAVERGGAHRLVRKRESVTDIFAVLRGGLGNQMFQYAAARALAIQTGGGVRLDIVTGFENDRFGRAYALGPFAIEAELVGATEYRSLPPAVRYRAFLRRKMEGLGLRLTGGTYCPVRQGSRQCICLNGYYQSYRYLECVASRIQRELTFKTPPILPKQLTELAARPNSVAVHVRRLHNVSANNGQRPDDYHALSRKYYADALQVIRQSPGRLPLLVFGDNVSWWSRQFAGLECAVATGAHSAGQHGDFYLMTQCRHHVISNSTFSWWAAYLGHSPDQIVCAPSNFSPLLTTPYRDIYPPQWKIIPL